MAVGAEVDAGRHATVVLRRQRQDRVLGDGRRRVDPPLRDGHRPGDRVRRRGRAHGVAADQSGGGGPGAGAHAGRASRGSAGSPTGAERSSTSPQGATSSIAMPSGSRSCSDGWPPSSTTPSWSMPTSVRCAAQASSEAPSGTASARWSRPSSGRGGRRHGAARGLGQHHDELPAAVLERDVADVRIVGERNQAQNGAVPRRTGATSDTRAARATAP